MGRCVAIAFILALGGCGSSSTNNEASENGIAGTGLAASSALTSGSGLTAQEEVDIKGAVLARLSVRRYDMYKRIPCTNIFNFGNVRIVDAALSEQTGKVRVIVPITAYRLEGNEARYWVPDGECFGIQDASGWVTGQPRDVAFEYDLEHWQSGWRVAQHQTTGL